MVKYIQYVHNFTVVPKYKNLFLHINLKLVPFAPNLPVHSLFININIKSNSIIFYKFRKINVAKFFENS